MKRYFWTIFLPYMWVLLFLALPFLIVMKLSVSEMALGLPPYTPIVFIQDLALNIRLNFENYYALFTDGFYLSSYLNAIKIAFFSTMGALFLSYPMAYAIARAKVQWRPVLLTLVILPSWTSFLLRVYAWMGLLQNDGYINQFLMALSWIDTPLSLLYTEFAVYVGMIYIYLPFMVLPIYVSLTKIDWTLLDAAADLGARPFTVFRTITMPLTYTGMVTGYLLVFIPAVGEFVVPDLLGGSQVNMIGRVVWQEFFNNRNWPLAAALATVMLILFMVLLAWLLRRGRDEQHA